MAVSLDRVKAIFKGKSVKIVTYKRAMNGRRAVHGHVTCLRKDLRATLSDPAVIAHLGLKSSSSPSTKQ